MSQIVTFKNSNNESLEFTDNSNFLIQGIEGLSGVSAKRVSYTGFMQDGEHYQSSSLEVRQIVLKFALLADSVDELLKARNRINKLFNPKLGNGELTYEVEGVKRKIVCVASSMPKMSGLTTGDYCKGEVILLAHDPHFTDMTETRVNVATWRNLLRFPITFTKEKQAFGFKEPSLIVNLENNGDVECGMTIEFVSKGAVKNPSLININTQEYIKLNHTMVAGEKIVITTSYGFKKVVSEVNSTRKNVMNYLDIDSTFLLLDVGDNLLRYGADDNLNHLEVNIIYSQRYLGV